MSRHRTVVVPVPRRLIWELRGRYDAAIVEVILRNQYYVGMVNAFSKRLAQVVMAFIMCVVLAWLGPGGVRPMAPLLILTGLLATAAFSRTLRRMRFYEKLRRDNIMANRERLVVIMEEMGPVEKECANGPFEDVSVVVPLPG